MFDSLPTCDHFLLNRFFIFESMFLRIISSFVDTSTKHCHYQHIFQTKYYGASSCLKSMYLTLKTTSHEMERGVCQERTSNSLSVRFIYKKITEQSSCRQLWKYLSPLKKVPFTVTILPATWDFYWWHTQHFQQIKKLKQVCGLGLPWNLYMLASCCAHHSYG